MFKQWPVKRRRGSIWDRSRLVQRQGERKSWVGKAGEIISLITPFTPVCHFERAESDFGAGVLNPGSPQGASMGDSGDIKTTKWKWKY